MILKTKLFCSLKEREKEKMENYLGSFHIFKPYSIFGVQKILLFKKTKTTSSQLVTNKGKNNVVITVY